MCNAFNEYMAYCSDQDNAGYSDVKVTINTLLEDLDEQSPEEQVGFREYETKTRTRSVKRNRGDYQYGKS